MKSCAIVGAGVFGRCLGLLLQRHGIHLEIFDPDGYPAKTSSGFQAGGMLAPFSEREQCETIISDLGELSLPLWADIDQQLSHGIGYRAKGTLIIAHSRDLPLWNQVTQKISKASKPDEISILAPQQLEPDLKNTFLKACFLSTEAHLDPRLFLKESFDGLLKGGATWHHQKILNLNTQESRNILGEFDWVVDARGIGARHEQKSLRGVRGEALLVHAPEVHLSRPIRLMHPRYALYIVPRANHHFYLGATQIEREDTTPITVRSSLELLSAAFSIDSGFAEASIIDSCVGLRPAYRDNIPQIRVKNNLIRVNGLYRHGFLLSPILAQSLYRFMTNDSQIPYYDQLFRGT